MGFYIKNIKIPENCTRCDYIGLNVAIECPVMSGTKGRATDCPLVDLGKCGRLIDFDALIEKYWDGNSMTITAWDLKDINAVIEAEDSE